MNYLRGYPPVRNRFKTYRFTRYERGFFVMTKNNLFEREAELKEDSRMPLAARMRPRDLGEFVGQSHILGPGKLLRRAIDADRLTSIILYGPPGTGKTALAHLISNVTKSYFEQLNAVTSSVSDIRDVLLRAKQRWLVNGQKTILFIDEIHRFNKAQQDVLMPDVEEGSITLIGATTHNPFFSIVSPLISRSQVFQLNPLSVNELLLILKNALKDKERGFGSLDIKAEEEAILHLAKLSDGDARRALKRLRSGEGYKYAHDYKDHYVLQKYLPEDKHYYEPSDMGYEKTIKKLMEERKGLKKD